MVSAEWTTGARRKPHFKTATHSPPSLWSRPGLNAGLLSKHCRLDSCAGEICSFGFFDDTARLILATMTTDQSPEASTENPHKALQSSSRTRKRVWRACMECHKRKIRCIVPKRGHSCLGCSVDNMACEFPVRKGRKGYVGTFDGA
jgi:hypothetical protein